MRQLDAGRRPLRLDETGQPGQRLALLVGPEAEIGGGDPAGRRHGGRLDNHQARPADGAASGVHEVPVVREAVLGRVLAHGRHEHAVAELDASQRRAA